MRYNVQSFPVGTSMGRFHATKMGDQVPVLGQEITEDPETVKQRKKGMMIQWNTDSVYTMALWSGKRLKTIFSNREFVCFSSLLSQRTPIGANGRC